MYKIKFFLRFSVTSVKNMDVCSGFKVVHLKILNTNVIVMHQKSTNN